MKALLLAALVLADTRFVTNYFVDPQSPEDTILKFNCQVDHPFRDPEWNVIWFYHAYGDEELTQDSWALLDRKMADDCSISLRTADWPGGQSFILVEQRTLGGTLVASGTVGFWLHTAGTPAPTSNPGERPTRPTFTVQP
jgi:hypothetical protein